MANTFKINLGATDTPYSVGLIDGDGTVPNLTGATVVFHLRSLDSTTLKVSAPGTTVGNPALGHVSYTWISSDVDTLGRFAATWEVTYPDLTVREYPSDESDLVEIVTGPNPGYLLQGACAPWTTVAEVRLVGTSLAISGASGYLSDDIVQSAINVATDLLFTLSGQQFPGECATILRPCSPRNCFGAYGAISSMPWIPDESALPPTPCGCGYMPSLDLGYWPVTNVVYAKVDGSFVDPTTYRLDQNRYLVHLDGASPDFTNNGWPSCQFLARPSTATGTFEVMIEHGIQPPSAGSYAAARLAYELLKPLNGGACQLPAKVTTANRQQLAFTMINPSMLDNGLTGIYEVDMFLMAYNPNRSRGQAMVWSPDLQHSSWRAGS
jgi:hypothetical protein